MTLESSTLTSGQTAEFVIGVGASAGGLEALQAFIPKLVETGRRAFVIVSHLDPDHASLLPELLRKHAQLPITSVVDGMMIEADNIYLIPPGASLRMAEKTLRLEPFDLPRGQRRPIDKFFASMAKDLRTNCACAILSGTGSDGTIGAKAVKEAGGLVLAQEPREAKYDGMPKSAISANAVDLVVPAEELADVLDQYFTKRNDIDPQLEANEEFLNRVTKHIRYRTGHDFSHYKTSMLLRRIVRRMSVLGIHNPSEYLQRLISGQDEATRLFCDLLINVTAFFRDRDVFDTLRREVLPSLIEGKGRSDDIRIWAPACSTGQEAYSLAILFEEEFRRLDVRPNVCVFATDIDTHALEVAREAHYPSSIASEMPQEFLDRHFTPTPHGYRINQSIREMVRVSAHNVIKDPPFSKLDLVSCRNLLIYFDQPLQEQTLPMFHYALKPEGFLMLGPSENVGKMADEFAPLNSVDRIFRKVKGSKLPNSFTRIPHFDMPSLAERLSRSTEQPAEDVRSEMEKIVHKAVLAHHAPTLVVINGSRELVYSSGKAGRYFELAAGDAKLNILHMAKGSLKNALRGLLTSTPNEIGRVVHRLYSGKLEDRPARILMSLERITDEDVLIVFNDSFDALTGTKISDETSSFDADYVRELEEKLDGARQVIRTTVEELETSNEELKSTNEEMLSMNEELQSANEELTSINDELQNKIRELNELNADQRNLIESTKIGTIFLDKELCVRSFTPEATKHFRLAEQDKGRPLRDIVSDVTKVDVVDSCARTLATGEAIETHIESIGATSYLLMRTHPYIDSGGEVDGVVVTFTDITELRLSTLSMEEARASATTRLSEIEELYRVTPQAKALIDRDLRFVRVNQVFANLSGITPDEHIGQRPSAVLPTLGKKLIEYGMNVLGTGLPQSSGEITFSSDGSSSPNVFEVDFYPVRQDNQVVSVGVNIRDVTKHKEMEAELRRLMRELQHRVKNMLANITDLIILARRESGDPRIILETLITRILALSNTHSLLTARNWTPMPLDEILKPELVDVYGGARIALVGPAIRVGSRAALALSMAVHELATNAAKYGALSVEARSLEVRWWRIDEGDGEHLVLSWKEMGGPSVSSPEKLGFGTQLIQTAIEKSLKGRCRLTYDSEGLQCEIAIPKHKWNEGATDDPNP